MSRPIPMVTKLRRPDIRIRGEYGRVNAGPFLDREAENLATQKLRGGYERDLNDPQVLANAIADDFFETHKGDVLTKGEASDYAGEIAKDPGVHRYVRAKAKALLANRGFKRRVARELREETKYFKDRDIESLNERMRLNELADQIEKDL